MHPEDISFSFDPATGLSNDGGETHANMLRFMTLRKSGYSYTYISDFKTIFNFYDSFTKLEQFEKWFLYIRRGNFTVRPEAPFAPWHLSGTVSRHGENIVPGFKPHGLF